MPPKKPYKKKSSVNNYLDPNVMNDISQVMNDVSRDDLFDAKNQLIDIFEKKEADILKKTNPKLVQKLLSEIYAVINDSKDMNSMFASLNVAVDAHRRKSDISLSRAKSDIMALWHDVANNNVTSKTDIPWAREFSSGEKFMTFSEKGERYIFKGFFNQGILKVSAYINEKGQDTVVLFPSELESLLAHDFVPSAAGLSEVAEKKEQKGFVFSKLKGIPSMTSLFVPRKYEFWLYADGKKWYSTDPDVKRPPKALIDSGVLKEVSGIDFLSKPVWSVTDIAHLTSLETQAKINELSLIRRPSHTYFNNPSNRDLDAIVEELMNSQIEQQKIKVGQVNNNEAYYNLTRDSICLPDKEKFKNPVSRYAVWAHELAHSTFFLLGRPHGKFGSKEYAAEEIVAETTSVLLTKEFEENLKALNGGELHEDWKKYFDDHYQNSVSYSSSWGKHIGFKNNFESLLSEEKKSPRKNVLTGIMGGILDAVSAIKTGQINGMDISIDLREQLVESGLKKLASEKTKELPKSLEI